MRWFLRILVLLVVVALVIQALPYGRDHDNPRTVREIKWDSPATRASVNNSCMDCHSNLTDWPWYASIAPISWLTSRDVEEGRAELNFSEWQRPQEANLQDVIDVIRSKEMPPLQYRAIHSEARLNNAERQQLEAGIRASWRADPPGS